MPSIPTSSPSSVHPLYENINKQQPLPQPSLSESAIRVSTNQQYATQMTSRPSRFVKPTSSSSSSMLNNNQFTLDMKNYIQLVENYSQKIYMEGYLMQNKKKYYAELCGSTFTLWDTTKPGATVTPEFIPIVLDINVYSSTTSSSSSSSSSSFSSSTTTNNHRQQFILELPHKNKTMKLNTLDPISLKKWIAAFRLACFERQLIHQFYTFHLLLQSDINTNHTSGGYLQVLLPKSKNNNEWKKLWVNIIPSSSNNNNNASRKSKLLSSSSSSLSSIPQLVLLENKKSKQPLLTLNCIHHAYALYPEMSSLIHQSTLIRLEGVQQNGEIMEILFMADSNHHMIQWLSTLYNAFSLYGLPQSLLQDPNNPSSLNFGEIILPSFHHDDDQQDDLSLHRINSQWWLETDDVIQNIDILSSSTNKHDMYQLFVNALSHKQQTSLQAQYQQRAKSLPLITVESIDPSRQRAASDAGLLNESSMVRSQVADSSDESEDDFEDEDEDEEPDSDDEPIGKSKPLVNKKNGLIHQSKENNSSSSLLIPDFDFGNGFDTTDKCESSNSSLKNELTATTSSGSSSLHSTSRRKSSHHQQKRQYSSSSSIMSNNSNGSGSNGSGNNDQQKKSNSSSILFGDFSLTADFNKYLDPTFTSSSSPSSKPSSRSPTPDRKYSLPLKSFSPVTNASNGFDRRKSLWDADDQHHGWDERSPRIRYTDEDIYQGDNEDDDDNNPSNPNGYDQEGPLIPSLNDHFAPQNSLLDNALGEQLSAKEQIEFARATGQPLIQVPTKQGPPKGGLVGVISERERHRRQGQNARVAERVQQHHFDRLEREKERRILEQRQQQMMKHQMMMYAANGYVHPMMMHSYMNPPSPGNNMIPIPPLMSPGSPHTSTSSPITPTSPMPSSPNGLLYGRPYSPSNNNYHSHPLLNNNNGIPMTPQYSARRYSRPLLSEEEDDDDDEDEPLYNTSLAYQQYPRTASPTIFHRKMNPMPSTSTGSSGIRL